MSKKVEDQIEKLEKELNKLKKDYEEEQKKEKYPFPLKWNDMKTINGYIISPHSFVIPFSKRDFSRENRNILPTEKQAHQILALCQLTYMRDLYRQGWEPDWKDSQWKYTIGRKENIICKDSLLNYSAFLSFQSAELRDLFYENNLNLIEKAGDYIN